MTAAVLQTPLEVILFFNSLVTHGTTLQSFQTISDSLKQDQNIRESDGFDEARLNPESLQQLYLTLLTEEVRTHQQQQQHRRKSTSPNGQDNGSPTSRKRKLSSPPLESLSDAQEYEHLLPTLGNKLYARYREWAIAEIRKEEDTYRRLHAQLGRLSHDGKIGQVNGDSARSNSDATGQPSPRDSRQLPNAGAIASTQRQHAGQPAQAPTGGVGSPAPRSSQVRPSPSAPASDPAAATATQATAQVEASLVSTSGPPSSQTLVPTDSQGLQASTQANTPIVPSQSQQTIEPSRRDILQGIIPSSSSPAQSLSPINPLDKPTQAAAGQISQHPNRGASSTPLAAHQQHSGPLGSSTVTPQLSTTQHIPPRQPFPHRGVPASQDQSIHQQQQLPQHSIHGTPAQRGQLGIPQSGVPAAQHLQHAFPQGQPTAGSQNAGFVKPSFPATPSNQLLLGQQTTPRQSSVARRNLPPLDTSASSTKWKVTSGRAREKSPERPQLSPLRIESDESGSEGEANVRVSRRSTAFDSSRATPVEKDETPSRSYTGRGRGRGGRGRGPGRPASGRRGSASASTRTRSQSVVSQPEDAAPSGKRDGRKNVQDPDTPVDERQASVPSSHAGTPIAAIGRRRANTVRGNDTPPQHPRPGQKRKRADTLDVGSPSSTGPATPRLPVAPIKPGYVLAVKNMQRIASTILNDVTTHRLASVFQKPISEREAPGYRALIYQPQDLKTIKSMIYAGQRAFNAAEEAAKEPGATPLQDGPRPGTIWLERTADVLPPRAIVNSSQLEAEICRIFANAVMFNPDPKRGVGPTFRARTRRAEALRREKLGIEEPEDDDSDDEAAEDEISTLVEDSRAMFRDVERQLAGWRAAERTGVGDGGGNSAAANTSTGAGADGALKDDSVMMEDAKDEEEGGGNAADEGEEGRPTRRRRL